jgi:hypothetical protein
MLTTPAEVFNLLEEIARQTNQTPTLYSPTREKEKGDEYTFAGTIKFFDTLIDVRRRDVVDVLRNWIRPGAHRNLRFLASDFIGKYQLTELMDELRSESLRGIRGFNQWNRLMEDEKFCTLNYMWAVSRCENPKYQWLKERLLDSDDLMIQEWILFIPLQMPEDQEFVEIIDSYLALRCRDAHFDKSENRYSESLKLVAHSLAALERERPGGGRKVLIKYSDLFRSSIKFPEIQKAWQDIGIPRELK